MREQKLNSTKIFSILSTLSKSTDQAKKHRGLLNLHKKQLKKFRDNFNSKITLRDCLEMPKIKLSEAKQILYNLENLPSIIKPQYAKEILSLQEDLQSNYKLDSKFSSLLNNYKTEDLWSMKYQKNDIERFTETYNEILLMYYQDNFKNDVLEKSLNEIEVLLKAHCLLMRLDTIEIKRDISTWEQIIKSLTEIYSSKEENKTVEQTINLTINSNVDKS